MSRNFTSIARDAFLSLLNNSAYHIPTYIKRDNFIKALEEINNENPESDYFRKEYKRHERPLIIRWMGVYGGYEKNFRQHLDWEVSKEAIQNKEVAAEAILIGMGGEGMTRQARIGFIYDEEDVREWYITDCYSELDENGMLYSEQGYTAYKSYDEMMAHEKYDYTYGHHTEVFLKKGRKPKALFVHSSKSQAPYYMEYLYTWCKNHDLNIIVFDKYNHYLEKETLIYLCPWDIKKKHHQEKKDVLNQLTQGFCFEDEFIKEYCDEEDLEDLLINLENKNINIYAPYEKLMDYEIPS